MQDPAWCLASVRAWPKKARRDERGHAGRRTESTYKQHRLTRNQTLTHVNLCYSNGGPAASNGPSFHQSRGSSLPHSRHQRKYHFESGRPTVSPSFHQIMLESISVAGSVEGVVALSDAVFGRIRRYGNEDTNTDNDIQQLATAIRSFSEVLHGLALVATDVEKDSLYDDLTIYHVNSCRKTLERIEAILDDQESVAGTLSELKSSPKDLKWPISASQTTELLRKIASHKVVINHAVAAREGSNAASPTGRVLTKNGALAFSDTKPCSSPTVEPGCHSGCGLHVFAKVAKRCKCIFKSNPPKRDSLRVLSQSKLPCARQLLTAIFRLCVNVDPPDRDGRTPLMIAIKEENLVLVKALIKAGADIRLQDRHGLCAIHHAAEVGNVSILRELGKFNRDWNVCPGTPTNMTCSALSTSSGRGHSQAVQYLIEQGANVNGKCRIHSDCTPLHFAMFSPDVQTIEVLAAKGAVLTERNRMGDQALHVAAFLGNIPVAEALIRRGCPLAVDSSGLTPEQLALQSGHLELSQLFEKASKQPGMFLSFCELSERFFGNSKPHWRNVGLLTVKSPVDLLHVLAFSATPPSSRQLT